MATKKKTKQAPNPSTHPMVMGETRSWAELDEALRKQGSSLAECVESLGGPKAKVK